MESAATLPSFGAVEARAELKSAEDFVQEFPVRCVRQEERLSKFPRAENLGSVLTSTGTLPRGEITKAVSSAAGVGQSGQQRRAAGGVREQVIEIGRSIRSDQTKSGLTTCQKLIISG